MSERAVRALSQGRAPVASAGCALWVRRADFLKALEDEPSAFAAGERVWAAAEPWIGAVLEAAGPAVRLAECREWTGLLDRHSDLEVVAEAGGCRLDWRAIHPVDASVHECEFRRGALSALLEDAGGRRPHVEHTLCRARGHACCVFRVEGLVPTADRAHARLLREAGLLSAALQGRETLFRRMAHHPASAGPFPDGRELQAVRRFMEDIEDIILVFDRNLCVIDANRAAVEFSGMTLDELRGLSARDLLSADSIQRVVQSVPLLLEQGHRRGLRVEGRTRTGWVPLELSARVVENRETVVCIARDISDHLRLERELAERNRLLRAQNERIRESDQLKSELLANVSHELTTPLTSIRGFAKLLHSDLETELAGGRVRLDAEKRLEFLRIVYHESDRMRELIAGLLELSQIESGMVTLDRAKVSLNALVRDALLLLKPRLHPRPHDGGGERARAMPEARLDPERLKQVVLNLLDNAVKFSPRGSRIRVETRSSRGTVELVVRNQTRDLSAEHLERIFDRFVQRDGSFRREAGGVGLGLNLVRAIVELHGGKAWSEIPEPGVIDFRVTLPIDADL